MKITDKKFMTPGLTEKLKRIMIFNAKGGVGKTALALNIALTYGYGIMTNDKLSAAREVLPENFFYLLNKRFPELEPEWRLIFDFGGFPDPNAIKALSHSQAVIIPILAKTENLPAAMDFIYELLHHKTSQKIAVVINQSQQPKDQKIRQALSGWENELKIFSIKSSTAFERMINEKASIIELIFKYPLFKRFFEPIAAQFKSITDYLTED